MKAYENGEGRSFLTWVTAEFALEPQRWNKTVKEIAAVVHSHPNKVSTWKRAILESVGNAYSDGIKNGLAEAEVEIPTITRFAMRYSANGSSDGPPCRDAE